MIMKSTQICKKALTINSDDNDYKNLKKSWINQMNREIKISMMYYSF